MRLFAFLLFSVALLPSSVLAAGVSPYLPLKSAPEFEHLIEKLLAKAPNADLMTKPYKAVDIDRLNDEIKDTDPLLHKKIKRYLSRYKRTGALTRAQVKLAYSNKDHNIPNGRGQNISDTIAVEADGFWLAHDNLLFSGAFIATDEDFIPINTLMSFGNEYAQVDIGYKDKWYSPFYDNAMLISSHAKTYPSITVSNYEPFTRFRFRYDFLLMQMDEQEAIRLGDESEPGKPYLAGTHLSFMPMDNLTIGLNRLFQFGGGPRTVTFKDFLQAFFDPVGKDNKASSGDFDDPNFEFGDQLASVTVKYNFDWFSHQGSLYGEIAGEDTEAHKNYKLGNTAVSVGLFLPEITEKSSLRIEHVTWQDAWYENSIYSEGNRNDGHVIGHWGGDERVDSSQQGAKSLSINWIYNHNETDVYDAKIRLLDNKDKDYDGYSIGYELDLRYSTFYDNAFWGLELIAGRDVYDEDYYRIAVSYSY